MATELASLSYLFQEALSDLTSNLTLFSYSTKSLTK